MTVMDHICIRHSTFVQIWPKRIISVVKTKSENPDIKPVKARTHRFGNSPIAYLTQLLNED